MKLDSGSHCPLRVSFLVAFFLLFLFLLEGTGAIWWRLQTLLLGGLLLPLAHDLFALLDVFVSSPSREAFGILPFWVHKQSLVSFFGSLASGFILNT